MPKVALLLEYNGAGFHGWQVQPGLRTIQGELQRVLETILREKIPTIEASGRTDAGVHSMGQVATFVTTQQIDLFRIAHSVTSLLKHEVSVISATFVEDDFHPRREALLKHYRYTIFNRPTAPVLDRHRVWHVATGLDLERMQRNAEILVGEHDFTSFRGAGCGAKTATRRIVESRIEVSRPYIKFVVTGEGFLKQMVRNLAGTLVGLGRNKIRDCTIADILDKRDRKAAGVTAPPGGLCLERVEYAAEIFPDLDSLRPIRTGRR